MSEATKTEKRLQHAVKETEFLRLRRSRLGVDDFDPIKVIGRGAFGEVSILTNISIDSYNRLHIAFGHKKVEFLRRKKSKLLVLSALCS